MNSKGETRRPRWNQRDRYCGSRGRGARGRLCRRLSSPIPEHGRQQHRVALCSFERYKYHVHRHRVVPAGPDGWMQDSVTLLRLLQTRMICRRGKFNRLSRLCIDRVIPSVVSHDCGGKHRRALRRLDGNGSWLLGPPVYWQSSPGSRDPEVSGSV